MPETTILSELGKQVKEEMANSLDILRVITEGSAEAFERGEITHTNALRTICRAATAATRVPKADRHGVVGSAVLRCFLARPTSPARRGPKGAPAWHKGVALYGLEWARQRGAVRSRDPLSGKRSSFDMVAEYLTSVGLSTTAAQVESWHLADTKEKKIQRTE